MTGQCFLTVLLFMISHGMEDKNLEFLFEKYIVTEHFDITLLGCPVEIKMHKKSLNDIGHRNWTANDSKLSSILSPSLLDSISDLVPAVIVRCHNGMEQRIGYISEEIFKHENKVVMDFGNKNYAWTLHKVVGIKDAKPQKLFWSNYGQTIAFTRKEYLESNTNLSENAFLEEEWIQELAAWKQKLVSCLSKNRNGVSLPKLGEICGKPRGFEKLKQAIKLVPCVSIVDLQSETNAQRYTKHVAILQNVWTNENIAQKCSNTEFAEWSQRLVSYLAENRKRVLLSELGEICGTPRGFETLKQAIELVPCVSVVDFPSKTNPKQTIHAAILKTDVPICSKNQQILTNEIIESPTKKILNAQQDQNFLSLQQHARKQNITKYRSKEQTLTLYPEVLSSLLAWTLSPEIENMSNYMDEGAGKEVILDDEMENKLLPEDLLSPRQGKTSNYEAEQKYLKNLHPKKD